MENLFRVCKKNHLPQDTGGSFVTSGRWHQLGSPVLYFCTSLPMCILELRANEVTFNTLRNDFHYSQCQTDISKSVEVVPNSFYGKNWKVDKFFSQKFGVEWLISKRSLFLGVSSAVLESETNYLINPLHSLFSKLIFSQPKPILLDERII